MIVKLYCRAYVCIVKVCVYCSLRAYVRFALWFIGSNRTGWHAWLPGKFTVLLLCL